MRVEEMVSKLRSALSWSLLFLVAGNASLGWCQPPEDQPQGPPVPPSEVMKCFKLPSHWTWDLLLHEPEITQPLMLQFDAHGRMWLVEYRQYPEPAGIRPLSRDNFWRIVYDRLPLPPGHGGVAGADRISIHADNDGNGSWETHSLFVDGLNIATAVLPVLDGAWVLNPPYLLFYPDLDHDGHADGTPEVHLEGFGIEDTHSVVNNLCLGPDGWLYAAQGSTVTAQVRKPNSPTTPDSQSPPVKSLGQLLWRYHPQTREYEVFAEGGGNAFGVAFDSQGRLFSGHNGGDTRGFHYLQGAYYRKGFTKHGSLSNPFAFGYLESMPHDPVQRFTHTMLALEGTSLEDPTQKSMLTVDPLHGKLFHTDLLPHGISYRTRDRESNLSSEDKWFRPVGVYTGPDGAAYVCDWYDFQVAHLYAHVGKMDRDHGRVYRLASSTTSATPWIPDQALDATERGLTYLAATLDHPYRWQRWKAIELLATHPLRHQLQESTLHHLQNHLPFPLEHLWFAHACGWLDDTIPFDATHQQFSQALTTTIVHHPDPMVRAWWIRLIGDDRTLNPSSLEHLRQLLATEENLEVIAQALCTAKRLPFHEATTILQTWWKRPLANQLDPTSAAWLDLLTWWVIETHADHPQQLIPFLFSDANFAHLKVMQERILPNSVQRWSMLGDPASQQAIRQLLLAIDHLAPDLRARSIARVIEGIERAYEGKSLVGLDPIVLEKLLATGNVPLSFRLRSGDPAAVEEAGRRILDPQEAKPQRLQWIQMAESIPSPAWWPILQSLIDSPSASLDTSLRVAALHSLKGIDDHRVASFLIARWSSLDGEPLLAASLTLASREAWTLEWLNASHERIIDPSRLPVEAQRSMRMHANATIQSGLDRYFTMPGSMTLDQAQRKVTEFSAILQEGNGDPYAGKKWFNAKCARCHRLFDQGGDIGPDLTGYQRDMLSTLLRNTVAPSLEIREGFEATSLVTSDGQILIGFIEHESEAEVALRGLDGRSQRIERSDIERIGKYPQSLMPEGLLDDLSPQELRDLLGYLRSSQPLFDGT